MNTTVVPTVLVVDDDRISRTILADLIKDECRVIMAKDGTSALRRVQEEAHIDLILLDVSMPDMDGYEVLSKLRASKRTEDTSVIFITGLREEEDEERGLELGAVDYISKPIRPLIVHARLRNHLKLVAQHRELERLAETDGLTGLANRRSFDKAFELAYRHTTRTSEPLGVAMIDVDYFKQYNDLYGHMAGDEVLRKIAQVLASAVQRPYDLAARYGGEEFVLLLPGTDRLGLILEKLRQDILNLCIEHKNSPLGVISLSFGGVQIMEKRTHDHIQILQQADELLYEAKRLGRNRVCTQDE